ncbi:MAG TPA: flagellar motor switch protein FliM, partial [Alcaligenaceae bacterium]|nr:flagellar motor switch protein FliM [Alcaligenaceae bacterium]
MPYQSFLSQDEVDALLAGVTGESEDSGQETDASDGIKAYDLTSPDRVIRNRMQTLELINERFARRMRSTLLSFMRRNADITVGSIR